MSEKKEGAAVKQVDTDAFVSVLKDLVQEGHEVSLLISGGSMAPFLIHQRDTIYFKTPDRPLRAGDMVFYQRPSGQYVMHRIHHIKNSGYYLVGDAQGEIEGPLDHSRIFGLITRVRRKGRLIGPGNFWWEFFEHVWRHLVPVRRPIVAAYAAFRSLLRR